MDLIQVTKSLIALCLLILLFRLDSLFVMGFIPRVPISLLRQAGDGNSSTPNEFLANFVKPGDRVVGGKPAYHGEFPYQVSLQKIGFFGGKTHYCGGSIISEYCIITAAHCLDSRSSDSIAIRVGSNTLRNDPLAKEAKIHKIIMHPDYDSSTIQHDIGIIKLKDKLNFKVNINRVPIVEFKKHVPIDTRCIVSGWGSTREGTSTTKTLMYADVPVLGDEICRKYYGSSEIYDSMVCAGYSEGGVDSCQGDSGGPLLCDGKLSGIVSWGIGCARAKYPGVYTELSYYTNWIESQNCDRAPPVEKPSLSFSSIIAGLMGFDTGRTSLNGTDLANGNFSEQTGQ